MLTVENLRKMGYRVRVGHSRNFIDSLVHTFDREFDPYGGSTQVEVYDFTTQQSYFGAAKCMKKDHYNRKLGVRIALGRALKAMGIPRKGVYK